MIVISRIFLPKDNKNLYHLIWENRNILVLEGRVFMAKNRWRRFNAYVGNKGLVNEYGKKISSKSLIIKKYDGEYGTGMIRLGDQVILENKSNQTIETYEIVPSSEVDIFNNKISEECNLGRLLLGKEVGQVIKLPTPIGVVRYQIMEIKQKLI